MTAYEMRISDWSSDVCSSDLDRAARDRGDARGKRRHIAGNVVGKLDDTAGLDPRRGFKLVHGDHWTGTNFGDVPFYMEVVEYGFQQASIAFQTGLVDQIGRAHV